MPVNIDWTVSMLLLDPELDGGTELLGAQTSPKSDSHSPGEKLVVQGIAPATAPGHVDDFS